MIKKPWLDLSEGSSQCCKLQPFQCKWAQDKHTYVFHWLQKSSMHKHEKQPGSRAELHGRKGKHMLWRWHLGWKAVIKLLLRTVKDYFHFCLLACCTKQQKKLSHVSLYWWTLKANFILKLNWGFSAGDVFVCVIRHRETIQFWNVFACDSTEMLETLA